MATPNIPAAVRLQDYLDSNSLYLVPSDPTHHQEWRNTWIDLFIVKSSDSVLELTKSTAPFIAGHDFVELRLNCTMTAAVVRTIALRDAKKVNPEQLSQSLH